MAAGQSDALFSVFRALTNSSRPADTARDLLNFARDLEQKEQKGSLPFAGSLSGAFCGVSGGHTTQHHCSTGEKVFWVANRRFEISKFKFKFPRARTYEIIGLVLGCIEAKFCK